ncbi:MAG: hypothetical protein JWM27_709 [Gemmatimonadetes bacterium]|nr:hypothetical protein [Gemmatimonadota bacterium]
MLALKNELDPGESEAIALALEAGADVLLLDEKRARTVAIGLGLRVVGLLGVVVLAKSRGLIPLAREVLDALVEQAGFRVAPGITRDVLRSVGEA